MSADASSTFIASEPVSISPPTGAIDDAAELVSMAGREAWRKVVDCTLIEWGARPEQLAEAELIPPTRPAVQRAIQIAESFRESSAPPPMRVVPDGDGGIVMERWTETTMRSIEIDRDGCAELVMTRDARVIERIRL
ncbi:MAG: hypothetical protein CHACPFDD_03205 [Phycisphaerae bacterium]|nr:hypothetical protein [Phycisphaerae bacterium]